MQSVHNRKSHDYANDGDRFSNFKYAAMVSAPFTDPVDRVFAVLIGIKLARIAELRKGKTPKNESLSDTFLDQSNYSTIWWNFFEEELQRHESARRMLLLQGRRKPNEVRSNQRRGILRVRRMR